MAAASSSSCRTRPARALLLLVLLLVLALCGGTTAAPASAAASPSRQQRRRTSVGAFVNRARLGRETHHPLASSSQGRPLISVTTALHTPLPPRHARLAPLSAGMWRFDKELTQPQPQDNGEGPGFDPPGKGLFRFVWGLLKKRTVQVMGLTAFALSAVKGGGGGRKGVGGKAGILDGGGAVNAPERYVRSKDPEPSQQQQQQQQQQQEQQEQQPQKQEQKKAAAAAAAAVSKSAAVPLPDAESPVLPPDDSSSSSSSSSSSKKGTTEEPAASATVPSSEQQQQQQEGEEGPAASAAAALALEGGNEGGREARPPWTPFKNWRSKEREARIRREGGKALQQQEEQQQQQQEQKEGEGAVGGVVILKEGKEEKKEEAPATGTSSSKQGEQRKDETKDSTTAKEDEEEVEEEEEDGTVPFDEREAPLMEDGEAFLARRGSILLGHPATSTPNKQTKKQQQQQQHQQQQKHPPSIIQIPDSSSSSSSTTTPPSIPPSLHPSPSRHGGSSSFVSGVFRAVGPAVPRIDCVKVYKGEIKFASGSGVIFTPEGYLITNSLLVRNALELKVTLADGREFPAEVKGMDEVLDVAVLKILPPSPSSSSSSSPPPSFEFDYAPIGDSDALQVGDWVLSIGSPRSPGPSVILGIVSGLTKTAAEVGRPETQVSFIQTDASFDAGVVGGPLVNEYGEVVGINSIGLTTSSTVQFSVPINQLKAAVEELAMGKEVLHPSIGVEMMPVTPTLAAQLNQQAAARQRQMQVEEEERVGRERVEQQQLQRKEQQHQQQQQQAEKGGGGGEGGRRRRGGMEGGRSALSQFLRKAQQAGQHLLQQPPHNQYPSSPSPSPSPSPPSSPSTTTTTPSSSSASQIHFIPEGGAVVVVNVLEDSPAQHAGLQHLDILLEIDRCPIYNVEDAQRIIHASGVGRDIEIKVLRSTQEVTVKVRTTDFLTLFRKQQTARRYPELKPKVGGGGREGGREGGWEELEREREGEEGREEGPLGEKGGVHQRSASDGGEEGEEGGKERGNAAVVTNKRKKEEKKRREGGDRQARREAEAPDELHGELWA